MNRAVPVVAVVLVLAAGCTGGEEPAGTPPSTTAAPPALTAADGSNFAACADGTCEVLVTGPADIPLTGQGGLQGISVAAVTAQGIDFKLNGGGEGSLSPGCIVTLYENGSGSSCSSGEPRKPDPVDGVLALQLTEVRDGKAVLRLVSGKVGPPPASLRPPVIPHWRP